MSMAERQNSPDKQNATKRPEQEQENPSKMMAPPPFALNASAGGGPQDGGKTTGDIGLGLDKKSPDGM